MSDTYELKAAMLAAKENSDLPVMATVIFGENGKMLTGATPEAVTALLGGAWYRRIWYELRPWTKANEANF